MMFLVIFSSLAAAMAIVSQGNLSTADSHLKINRTLAAAETGMRFMTHRIAQAAANVRTRSGEINASNAPPLWDEMRAELLTAFAGELHNLAEPALIGKGIRIGPISLGADSPSFTATLTPHPLPGEDYNSAYYSRPPYSTMSPPVSSAAPLDATWVRVRVEASEGPAGRAITRSVQLDYKLDKKIRFAILSKSRVMIGRNVMIEGPIGSRFMETHLEHGHPVQMLSDFVGLHDDLDAALVKLINTLATNDRDGDNRLSLASAAEIDGIDDPYALDTSGDGYIDDYDFFLAQYDANRDGQVTGIELDTSGNIRTAQLLQLIDTFGDPSRGGYGDGVIDASDRYAKVRGQIMISAQLQSWQDGAAGGQYQDYFQGPIHPEHNQAPLKFQAGDTTVHQFEPSDFDVSAFRAMASGDLAAQATQQASKHDPNNPSSPGSLGQQTREEVPYGAAYPYDYYDRPVYENMTFTNVKIPRGTNALFKNCRFIGCTFIETSTDNVDPNFNFAGVEQADGTLRFPNRKALVNGVEVSNTKTVSNNVRFDGCAFEGAVISDSPPSYTHVRNKIAFTGSTRFDLDSVNLTDDQKSLFRRSTILTPHYSVEMGTFIDPTAASETVKLSGTIVAGVLDMRGQVRINGTVLTTFEPTSNTGPVVGETSPQFNTTLGYFSSKTGDMEAELPSGGLGVIQLRYDPTLPLPDGILGPIELRPVYATYSEGGAK